MADRGPTDTITQVRPLVYPAGGADDAPATLLTALTRQWRLAAGVAVVTAVVLVAGVLLSIRPQFMVSATVHLAPVVRPILFEDADTDISRQFNVFIATQAQAVVSPSVLEATAALPEVKALPSITALPDPAAILKGRLAVEQVRGTELITVSMVGERAADMVTIVNGLLKAYLASLDEDQRRWDDKVLSSLKKEEGDLSQRLAAKRESVRELSSRMISGTASVEGGGEDLRYGDLQGKLTQARMDIVVAKAKLKTMEDPNGLKAAVEGEGFEVFRNADPQWAGLGEQLRNFSIAALNGAAQGHGPEHPEERNRPGTYAALRRQLETREAELREEFAKTLRLRLESKIRDAEATAGALKEEIAGVTTDRMSLAQQQVVLKDLQEERQRLEQTHLQVRQKIWNVEVEQHRMSRVTVQSPPTAPEAPNLDRRPKFLTAALVASLFAGVAAALVRTRLDHRVREPGQVSSRFGLPVLGSIQSLPHLNGRADLRDNRLLESMRVICTALLPSGKRPTQRVRLVTSPTRGAGKSTVATNLARSLAVSGQKVLFVDADNQGQGATRNLGLVGSPGLKEYLEGALSSEAVIRPGEVENLHVIPAGTRMDHFGELLARQPSQERMRALFAGYDEVIVDSAPVLASSSSVILATLVDEIVLVLRAGRSTNEEVQAARRHLAMVGGKIVGAVLNAVDGRGSTYLYSYAYQPETTAV